MEVKCILVKAVKRTDLGHNNQRIIFRAASRRLSDIEGTSLGVRVGLGPGSDWDK